MQRHRCRLIALILAIAVGLGPGAYAGQRTALPPEPTRCPGDYAPGIVLVGTHGSASGAETPKAGERLRALLQEEGWDNGQLNASRRILSHETGVVHAVRVPLGRECAAVQALRQDPDVAFAELDYATHVTDVTTPNDPRWIYQWGPARIEAPTAWDITTGTAGVIIAIVDTGVQLDHEDLADNIWTNPYEIPDNGLDDDGNGYVDDSHGWDFVNDDNDPWDDHGHGTHVAGIAAARINNGVGIAGMAGGARLMSIKVISADNLGSYSDLAQAIAYAVDNGVRIVNVSVGGDESSEVLQRAVDYAQDRGVLVVAAAGNNGPGVLYPAACEGALAVAATDEDDEWSSFSNRGPDVDVAAPGANIYSTGWIGDSRCTAGYCSKSGTSMATPHVAGLAALMWSARPDLTHVQVTKIITSTTIDVNEGALPGWDEYAGWGRIDASAAISEALALPANVYGVETAPSGAAMTASLGSLATYTLTVRNAGNTRDAYVVELDGNAWEARPSTDLIGPMDPDRIQTLDVTVAVPLTARSGLTDTLNVTLTSVGDPIKSATSTLTTTATGEVHYLPIVYQGE